jgi:hypothetical protein
MEPELFDRLRHETPSPERVAAIRKTAAASLKRVRPLPSNAVLIAISTIVFVLAAIAEASIVGFPGFHALSLTQMLVEYSAVLASAVVLSISVVAQMIPGTRLRVPPVLALLGPLVLLGLLIPLLFPDFTMNDFVRTGVFCLRLGTLCALAGGVLAWAFLRLGFVTGPMPAALAAAGISGLLGVGVLALHCPILDAAHILVWHLGVIVVALAGGALVGYAASR